MIEFVIDYVERVRERQVLPSVEPGYLQPLVPDKPPYLREPWAKIMPDIERYIMPGVSSKSEAQRSRDSRGVPSGLAGHFIWPPSAFISHHANPPATRWPSITTLAGVPQDDLSGGCYGK